MIPTRLPRGHDYRKFLFDHPNAQVGRNTELGHEFSMLSNIGLFVLWSRNSRQVPANLLSRQTLT
jgi:hypothetical protein